MHSHILPDIDDGVKTPEEAVNVVRRLRDFGFSTVVATPHFYPGRYTPSLEVINDRIDTLRQELQRADIPVEILRGRECFFDYELVTAEDRDSFPFTWNQKRYQLIELPQLTVPHAIRSYIVSIRKQDIQPILAHAERYSHVIQNPEMIEEFMEMGFLVQVDLRSYSKAAHKAIRNAALTLLDKGHVDFLASDVHAESQLDEIAEGIAFVKKRCGEDRFRAFCDLS